MAWLDQTAMMRPRNPWFVLGWMVGYVLGTCLVFAALIAVLVILMMQGLGGMVLAFVVLVAIGALWSSADERRMERQYKEDTKCS